MQLRIPPVGLIYTQSTKAQLQKSKCEKGIQLAKFSKYSLFRYATPPIQERHILTHVDTTSLDNFGMGKRLEFVHADVSLVDLLTFRTSLSDPVQVTTCSDGAFTNHTLSLEWNTSRYEPGIRFVYEPEFDAGYGEYESFAGLTITQLTQNDIEGWVKAKSGQSLARFQLEEYMEQPRVAISSCESGATCDYVLNAGMIIDKLNGCNISTLADVRRCFVPFGRTLWELVTDRGYIFQADFDKEMAKEVEKSNKDPSVMSQAVARASGLLTTTTTTLDAATEMEANFPISEARPDLSMTPPLEVKFGGHTLRGDEILSSGVLKKKRKRWKRMHSKYVDEHGDAAPLMAEQSEAWLPGMAEESEAWLPGMG